MRKPLKHLTNLLRFSRDGNITPMGPLKAEWEVINTCNAKCKICLDWKEKPDSKTLNTAEGKSLIMQLSNSGLINLTFSGGEPLLRKDLMELIAFAGGQGLSTELISNGLLITERHARKLVDAKLDTIIISIDAANARLNDRLRGLKGYFDLALTAIDNIKAMRRNATPKIVIKATVTSKNVQELVPLAELAVVKGIEGFNFQLAQVLENKNFVFDRSLLIDARNQKPFIDQLHKLLSDYRDILTGSEEYYKTLCSVLENPAHEHRYRPVSYFLLLQIDAWGNIYTSPAKNNKIGNIKEESFENIWYGQKANALRKSEEVELDSTYLFDATGSAGVEVSHLHMKRFFKLMRPIFNSAKLF